MITADHWMMLIALAFLIIAQLFTLLLIGNIQHKVEKMYAAALYTREEWRKWERKE